MADTRRVGCCRAAVDSEGNRHDHAEWYRDLQLAHAELDRLAGVEAKAIRVCQLAERDNTAGTYKAIAELRRVLDERGGGR